jgi:hypothetical protein
MSKYIEEYEIAGRQYGIEDDGQGFCIYCDGEPVGGRKESERGARRVIMSHAVSHLNQQMEELTKHQTVYSQTIIELTRRTKGPAENNLIPFLKAERSNRVKPKVDIRIDHHFSALGACQIVEILASPEESVVGHRYMYGLPIDCFHVPTETGRVYRLTIEELPESDPKPEENPWRPGEKY